MGKYDGLIIPRSYNDYYNKSQPEELRNGIIQNTLGALDTDKGQPVNSAAVNNALANCITQDDLHLLEVGVIPPEQIEGNNHISKTLNLQHTYKLDARISFVLTPVSYRDTAYITATGHWGVLGGDAEGLVQTDKLTVYITNLYQNPQTSGCYYQIFGNKTSIVNQ